MQRLLEREAAALLLHALVHLLQRVVHAHVELEHLLLELRVQPARVLRALQPLQMLLHLLRHRLVKRRVCAVRTLHLYLYKGSYSYVRVVTR